MSERYDAQVTLFEDHDIHVQKDWGTFVYWEVFPNLLDDDELVRNILRALGGLSCRSPEEAALTVRLYINEMALPTAPPPWAPEEVIE